MTDVLAHRMSNAQNPARAAKSAKPLRVPMFAWDSRATRTAVGRFVTTQERSGDRDWSLWVAASGEDLMATGRDLVLDPAVSLGVISRAGQLG